MKRFLTILLALVLTVTLSGFASAAGNSYTVEEYGVTLEMPDNFLVITPDSIPDDAVLNMLDMTREDIIDMFDTMPLYLDAVSLDPFCEITLTIQKSDIPDYREIGPTTLDMIIPEITSVYSYAGIEVLASDVYIHEQTPFMRVYTAPSAYSLAGVLYSTVLGGYTYTLTMQTVEDTLSEENDALLLGVVDSMYFEGYPALAEAEAFTYTNDAFGVSFTVPAGWQQTEVDEEPSVTSVIFTSEKDSAAKIMFTAQDIWDSIPSYMKTFFSREDIDNSMLSPEEIAIMTGASSGDAEFVTIAGNEYCKTAVNGIDVLLRVHNSVVYMFYYTGSHNTGLYEDFMALVSSVNYAE